MLKAATPSAGASVKNAATLPLDAAGVVVEVALVIPAQPLRPRRPSAASSAAETVLQGILCFVTSAP
jgi:hypothetical protein